MKSIVEIPTISAPNITLAHLRVLVAVVDEGGFTAAAKKLGVTQSGASQALQVLEDTLGSPLLARRRDRVEPTEIGIRILAEAREALRTVERIYEHTAAWKGLDHGSLRIGSVVSAASQILPAYLRAFRTRYPKIEVSLLEGSDDEVRDWAVRDAIDIGLTSQTAADLTSETVAEDEYVVAASARHHRSLPQTLTIAQIAGRPFIMSASGCEPAIQGMFAEEKCAPDIAFRVRDMGTLLEMVRQGLGVSIIPALSAPGIQSGLRLHKLNPARRRMLLLVRNSQSILKPAVRAFVDLIRSEPNDQASARKRSVALRSLGRKTR
ncbi:LysR family transcriptional regulator [Rhizobium leguminosarum]|uniref:LysR family transcriptional regulator n=1 Tax=Rhizobium leguminosarum TaxID=384 RepID=UPI000FEC75A8|nr:LysR family transcriptional regulator [Rhizobium leguminosarum]RWX12891.1 LysR family transcriptional regulator [Rhizobium leguminosarum]